MKWANWPRLAVVPVVVDWTLDLASHCCMAMRSLDWSANWASSFLFEHTKNNPVKNKTKNLVYQNRKINVKPNFQAEIASKPVWEFPNRQTAADIRSNSTVWNRLSKRLCIFLSPIEKALKFQIKKIYIYYYFFQ